MKTNNKQNIESLEDRLQTELYQFHMEFRHEPVCIIMHPKTYYDFFNELISTYNMSFNGGIEDNKYNGFLFYRGIKIYRSLDIDEGNFIVK